MPQCNGITRKGLRCSRVLPEHSDMCYQHKNSGNADECSICLENLKFSRKKVFTTTCNHKFHASCMNTWLSQNDTCPYCRETLKSPKPVLTIHQVVVAMMIEEHNRRISEAERNRGFRGLLRQMFCMR